MPQKKKAGSAKNGFHYFVLELINQQAQKGNRYSFPDAAKMADPKWAVMTPEEKKHYHNLAASHSSKKGGDMSKKYTSAGISYAEQEADQKEKEEALSLMITTIKNTVGNLDVKSTLKDHKFFVCHINYFFKETKQIYWPAEIALTVFSLQCGVVDHIHFFTDFRKIPLGFKYEAADWSSRTHGIPVCDETWKDCIKEPVEAFNKLKNFIAKFVDGPMPPIYTMFDTLNTDSRLSVVKCVLNKLCNAVGEDNSLFRVYSLPYLFYELRTKGGSSIPSVAIMKNELDKDLFSYARDIGCYYHEEKDLSIYCSLSIVTRWVFTICDHCCHHFDIKLTLGRHVPRDADISKKKSNIEDKMSLLTLEQPKIPSKLTIIDHGHLKEQRAEHRRALDEHLQKSEKIRLPKQRYSNKIGACFQGQDISATSSQSSNQTPNNDVWETMIKGKPFGRGRGVRETSPEQPVWPVSGRGRAFLGQ